MSYQEKRTLTSILTGILVLVAYGGFAYSKVSSNPAISVDLHFWAVTMLSFIGIGIVAAIIIQIIFHILFSVSIAVKNAIKDEKHDDKDLEKMIQIETVEDERDQLIELKSHRIGFAFAGIGFVAALVSLAFEGTPVVMLNIMYLSFGVGSILEGFVQLRLYRKGC